MSISTIQEKLFNKGCGSVLAVGAAILMGVSIFSQCNLASSMDRQNGRQTAVATVDGIPLNAEAIATQAARIQERSFGGTDITSKATSYAYAIHTALREAAVRSLLAKEGAISDSEVKDAAERVSEQQIDQVKGGLIQRQKVKPNATEADFDKAYAAENNGKSLADLRKNNVIVFTDAYKDQTKKESVIEILGDQILMGRYGGKAVSSDAALRDSYKLYNLKRIFFSAQSGSKETPEARADKAMADLKAGKSFDLLMDTLSNDPPMPGKAIHEKTDPTSTDLMDRQPELAALKTKAPASTTGVIDVPGGKAIYELASVSDSVPGDFDKNKEKYRAERMAQVGRPELDKRLDAILNSDAVKWQHEGYHALAAVADVIAQPTGGTEAGLAKAFQVAETAYKSKDPDEKQKAAMAMLAATAMLDNLQSADAVKTKALQLTALEAVTGAGMQDSAISLKLADLYGDAKKGDKATEALISASKSNSRYDAVGEAIFRQVVDKALKFEKDKLITKEQLESIQAQQALWSEARSSSEKADAEAKAEIDKQKKENEAELAKQKAAAGVKGTASEEENKKANEAELAKQKAEAEKASGKPAAPAPDAPKKGGK